VDEIDIGEVRERTGLQPSTLRYYEQRGLIASSGRSGLRRRYRPDVLRRIALVRAAQAAGFTLTETADLLDVKPSDTELRKRLSAKADELDERIQLLATMRDQLRHAVDCRSPRLTDCPNFQQCLDSFLASPRYTPTDHHQR
jgi:redox-sensitive transcriptional activator SoxR